MAGRKKSREREVEKREARAREIAFERKKNSRRTQKDGAIQQAFISSVNNGVGRCSFTIMTETGGGWSWWTPRQEEKEIACRGWTCWQNCLVLQIRAQGRVEGKEPVAGSGRVVCCQQALEVIKGSNGKC